MVGRRKPAPPPAESKDVTVHILQMPLDDQQSQDFGTSIR
jgi:hypothetical protein